MRSSWSNLRIGIMLLGPLLAIILASPASADTYTYTYTGNEFNQNGTGGPPAPGFTSISGYFTLSTPFVPFTDAIEGISYPPQGYFATVDPLTYSFSDGRDTLTPLNSTSTFQLGEQGDFSFVGPQWIITITGTGVGSITTIANGSGDENGKDIGADASGVAALEYTFPGCETNTNFVCYGKPGTWTVAVSTPEPSSLLLLSTGLLSMLGFGLQRKPLR